MPFYLRQSLRIGPFRFNLSKSGVGVSAGVKGFRVGTGPRGHYVHAGRGGLVYRKTFSPRRAGTPLRSPPPPPPSARTEAPSALDEIESGDVLAMADESSAELLAELNRKRQLWRWGPIAFGLALVLLLGALITRETVLLGMGMMAVVGAIAVWILDVRRKTTALFYQLEPPILSAVERLHTALDAIASCQRIWLVEARDTPSDRKPNTGTTSRVRRIPVQLREATPPFVKTNIRPLLLPAGRQQLFFLPDRLLVLAENGYGAVPYSDLSCEVRSTRFVEEGGVPSDCRMVDHTWKHVTKKGEPDRRFRDNPQIPIVSYGELTLRSSTGLNEHFQFSREGAAEELPNALVGLATALASAPVVPHSNGAASAVETSPPILGSTKTLEPSASGDSSATALPLDQSYYLFRSGVEGPFTLEQLEARLATGDLSPEFLVCPGQTGQWRPLREFLGNPQGT
ncbi:MAG: DUF4236 domain-containing protein [Verrucomicrobia bacterium]|nr:DUF4236 domain-containing protein [Verrucomicrobiota bacterium]